MRFLRTFSTDMRRMLLSGKFYTALLAVAAIAFLGIWPEVQASDYQASVYYLVNGRGGISAFFLAISVLIVLPYALSSREDALHNYVHGMESRAGLKNYTWSKILTASAGAFLVVFLGYILCFGLLSLKLPMIKANQREFLLQKASEGTINFYDTLIVSGHPALYAAAQFFTEAMGYAFMAGFALMLSAKLENVFVLLSVPILLYYVSAFICSITLAPSIFNWYYVMSSGGWLKWYSPDIARLLLYVFLYFGSLIFLEGIVYYFWMKRRRIHG